MSDGIKEDWVVVDDTWLDDLRVPLSSTRYPVAELVDDWSRDAARVWVQQRCRHWADTDDWRHREALLNRPAPFTTEIDLLAIHLMRLPSPRPRAIPRILRIKAVVQVGWMPWWTRVVGPMLGFRPDRRQERVAHNVHWFNQVASNEHH